MGLDLHNYKIHPVSNRFVFEHLLDGQRCIVAVKDAPVGVSELLAMATQHNAEEHCEGENV